MGETGRVHTEQAPAKLTLSLRVTGRRRDGLHLLDAEMVSIDLSDTLRFGFGRRLTVTRDATVGQHVPADRDNLVLRAMAAVGRRARVHLHKRVPVGGGLGGGSADAAAVLRWAGCCDLAVAASLGADVPFCVAGGRARVSGVGEVLEPLPFEERTFTLLVPPMAVPTADVYRMWDELGGPHGEAGNDLEPAALAVAPALAVWRDRLAEVSGQRPRLAGSGSTWFVEGPFPGDGRLVVATTPAGGSRQA